MSSQVIEQLLWTEKYRPRSLKDVVNQTEIVKRLLVFVNEKNMPHLLFVGPPGVGKTTVALALVQDLYGSNYRRYVLETNASDERGIDVIRTKIKEFSRSAVVGEIPFKVVILDEADNMCLHPKTKVLVGKLDNLKIKTLEELYREYGDKEFDIPSLNPLTLKPENDKGRIVDSGKADLYEIIFEDGSRVLASPEHPFFIINNGNLKIIRAGQLRKGMSVATFKDKISRCLNCGKIYYIEGRSIYNFLNRYLCSEKCLNTLNINRVNVNNYMAKTRLTRLINRNRSRISIVKLVSRITYSRRAYRGIAASKFIDPKLIVRKLIIEKLNRIGITPLIGTGLSNIVVPLHGDSININIANISDALIDKLIKHRIPIRDNTVFIDPKDVVMDPLKLYREVYEVSTLSGLTSVSIKHVKVISIRYIGRHKVLNISMNKNKNFFLANGILTHNTSDAQQALRRLMEMYVETTRFILLANYPSKIIDPIQSRCALFRFTPLKREDIVERLKYIADNEKVSYDLEALDTIYEISEGDMRKSINILQAAAAIGKVTVSTVYRVVGLAHPKEIREMVQLALTGKFIEARDKLRQIMIEYGLSGIDVVKQIHREIFSPDIKIPEDLRVYIADYTGEINYRLVEGADDEIQINALLARLAMLGKKISG